MRQAPHPQARSGGPSPASSAACGRTAVRHARRRARPILGAPFAVSAIGLGVTGLAELLAMLTGAVGLLSDAIHNLSDVSTSAVVFLGFLLSRRAPTKKYPYRLERAEDLAEVCIAVVIWASAAFAGYESIRKLMGMATWPSSGRPAPAPCSASSATRSSPVQLAVGRRINSATLIADARHSWLGALTSAGALAGLVAVALGQPWGDPVAGLAVTAFICHVGWEVTAGVLHRLADGVDPEVITRAEAAAGSVPGVIYAHARARWTGRSLRVEFEAWVDPDTSARGADGLGRLVADEISRQLPEAGAFTWTTRAGAPCPPPRT